MTTTSEDDTVTTTETITVATTRNSHYPNEVIPYGLGDGSEWRFDLIHATGLVSLILSVTACVVTLALILRADSKKNLFLRPIGERLVIYLAGCNLLYCMSHIMDHSYMFAVRGNPPDAACAAFAFFLNEFVVAQALIVSFTAVNAFVMVVKEKKVPLGKNDWGIFVYSLGIPLCVGIVGVASRHFGPSGLWCYMDHRTKAGHILTNIVGVVMLITFLFNVACYSAVWIKIKQAAAKMGNKKDSKYTKSAQTMMLFVAVYIAQWWAYVVYAVWNIFDDPHIVIMVGSVLFSNMGGVYNLITYLLMIRQKKVKPAKSDPPSASVYQKGKTGGITGTATKDVAATESTSAD